MVVRGSLDGQPITLSLKRGALTVALDERTVLAVDRAGRLWSYYTEGYHFRRGLNGGVLAKWTQEGVRQRRRLGRSESDLVVGRAALILEALRDRLELETAPAIRSQTTPEVASEIRKILARAADFDVQAAHADVDHYHQVYKPIGILPPDQYMALVLQVTEGCSFNSCTFCSFYKERPFRIKSPQELRTHITSVRTYLGDSVSMREGIFLADANALVVPQRQMVELLEVIVKEMGKPQEMFAFLDGFSGRKKSAKDYVALAERGLRRVYVGLESGHDPLLAWVRKPGRAADAVAAVRRMKAGGVRVGVIILLGIGGTHFAEGHIRDTIAAVNQMELGLGDLLYFSEFIPAGTPYETHAAAPELSPLSRQQMQAQRETIISGLSLDEPRPRIATYDIREFVY
jgi:radical SAM superfamily enzyme YgiQ (UPF0313 family)